MRNPQRGSALIIATIVVLIIAVIGVGMVRFTQRQTAGALAGTRADSISACAEAARKLLESRFHALYAVKPVDVSVLKVALDGPGGRQAAVGGHIDADPSAAVAVIKQVEPLSPGVNKIEYSGIDSTNALRVQSMGTGAPLKVTVHCQEGDLSSPTSGRQLEIEYAVRFGL